MMLLVKMTKCPHEDSPKMLVSGDDIIKVIKITGLTRTEIDEIQKPEVA